MTDWYGERDEAELDGVALYNPEMAWQTWALMEMTGWQHLPRGGGLLDQPEALWHDLMVVSRVAQDVKAMLDED